MPLASDDFSYPRYPQNNEWIEPGTNDGGATASQRCRLRCVSDAMDPYSAGSSATGR